MGVWGLFSERTFISTTFSKKPDTKSHRDEDVLLKSAAQQPFPFPPLLRTSRTNPIRPWSREDGSNGLFQAISMIVERFVHKGTTRINNHKLWKSLPLSSHTLNTFPPSYLSDFDSENTELFLIAPAKWMLYQLCASRGQSMGLDVPDWAAPHISPPGMQQKLPLSLARLWGSWAAEYWMWR